MTDKNKEVNSEDILNVYDDGSSDDLFSTTSEEKKDIINDSSFETKDKKTEEGDGIDIVSTPHIEKELDEIPVGIKADEAIKKGFEEELKEINGEKNELSEDELSDKKNKGSKMGFFSKLFKKKEKIEDEDLSEDKEDGSSNIFDDFKEDGSLLEEVDQIKNERNKDIFHYLEKINSFLQVIFILALLSITLLYGYIYLQNKVFDTNKDKQILEPFCTLLLGDVHYEGNFCTSISTLQRDYKKRLNDTKELQISDILNILQRLYKIENFTKTKDVIFLKDKTEGKLKVLDILKAFDDLKYQFDTVDKDKIQCNNLSIDEKTKILTMNCVAYSAGFESGIRGFDGKNTQDSSLKGTSISIANSFLNYIAVESDIFTIIDRQKTFKSDSIVGEKTGFTNKTSFGLKLKYNIK